MRACENQRGFTLLEILVALAILAISLGVLLRIFAGTLRRQTVLADQRAAIWLAESKLESVGNEAPLADGITEGVFDNGFGWRLEIAPYQAGAPSSLLAAKLATLTVRWPRANSSRTLIIETIRLVGHD